MGIYEKLLHAIGNIFTEMRKSLEFLIPVFLGMGISVISLAKLFGYLIDINSFIVLLFFMGLLVGGTKAIYQKGTETDPKLDLKAIIPALISFTIIILLIVFGKLGDTNGIASIDINFFNVILLFFLGMAASMTMIVPGISGSALLIVLGYYTLIVTNVVGNILDFSNLGYHISVVIPFGLGAAAGIILFSKVIEYALKNFTKQTYFAILGFILGSVIAIFFEIKDPATGATHDLQTPIYQNLLMYLGDHVLTLIFGIILFAIGFVVAMYLGKYEITDND
jgi:putative membrane protein